MIKELGGLTMSEFEKVADGVYSVTVKVKKGLAVSWEQSFREAAKQGEPVVLKFFALLGYDLKAPIINLTATEYDERFPYDTVDLLVRLTPELLAQIYPPEISTEFGY